MNGVVLISGGGSNLQSIIDNVSAIDLNIICVISSNADAYGLKRAEKAGIPIAVVDHQLFDSRLTADKKIMKVIDDAKVEVIILAGYMRILSPEFIDKYLGKILNIHPSLLPKFKGLNTHQRAIDAAEKIHGASVHFVTEELDGGPVIAQRSVEIDSIDNAKSLASKVLKKEHDLYPKIIHWYTQGRIKLIGNNNVQLDGQII
ncbi:MAG: phosphoribosylglycinamide formyltransferase [Candidatus Marinimicrobia bacterium]|mgnify:CR=1 FL=1|jgi:phosphoribosylglycinamide formyltransferase-1|nr:phosphoribosylglycinamide formyltransferase [Candidatus Neomarinimicrobiota bacterium]|tara:strand:- start:1360 stop:1968 length:609 start_codon:yes stop_codon:yes gene_type:complete